VKSRNTGIVSVAALEVACRASGLAAADASANRDERHYPKSDRFDIERNPRDHLGWGHGVHSCFGIHLARMELEILLEALAARVERIDAGSPTRLVNNAAQGYATLPLRLQRAPPADGTHPSGVV
jgi:cytochrome P450